MAKHYKAQRPLKVVADPEDGYLDSDSEVDEFATHPELDSGDGLGSEGHEDGAAGQGQWEPDAWDGKSDSGAGSSDEESDPDEADQEDDESAQLNSLQNGLAAVPFSTLLKAQKALNKPARFDDGREQVTKTRIAGPSRQPLDQVRMMKRQLAELQRRKGKAVAVVDDDEDDDPPNRGDFEGRDGQATKRDSKNAPAAMSTKRQVSRSRQVVDTHKSERRDPRFSSISAGQVDPQLQGRTYSFLGDILRDEFDGLKLAVRTALKVENSCPLAQKPARTTEREALERQLAQARAKLDRAARETRERAALSAAKKQENEKRLQGKGAWYMKKSAKRDLLLKSRFEALEKEGGRSAVKKALEKKRKKTAAKEKKSRPFARGTA